MNPHDAAHALVKALRESSDFKDLKTAQEALKADPSARNMLSDFRREQLNVEKQQFSGVEISKEQQEKLEKLYEVINMNMLVKNFLQAEYRVAVILQDIHKIIGEATNELIDPELIDLPEEDTGDQEE